MCGIAGIIDYRGDASLTESVQAMVKKIAHRGPDGLGHKVTKNVALGHSRLSIIDPEGGAQPMSSSDGQIQVTFNGEIYNYQELRKQLKRKGHDFRTNSDTEVILYSYREWGKHCVDYFEGMFAFAIADFTKNEMFLARDPFGIKPLLYRVQYGSFTFASEFQAFHVLPDWSGEIDLTSIDLYLRYQYIPAPNTVFRKVYKLPAGHCMTVRMGEAHQKIERYWEPDFSEKKSVSSTGLIELLDDALRDSVRRHLISDVPFGALLSGGVDSSLVVGYMAEILDTPVKTFSIGFDDENVNELPFARHVAEKYATDHHEEIVRFDALEILPDLVKHHGEPFGDQSAIPTWYVSKLARSKVPMVLSGDGGDELLAGYGTYGNWLRKLDHFRQEPETGWKQYAKPLARSIMPSRYSKTVTSKDNHKLWTDCVIRFNQKQRESLWRNEYRFLADQDCRSFERAFEAGEETEDVNRVQRADLETFLPEDILCKVDISSMRYGLEIRPPMLDRRFFGVCSSIKARKLYSCDQLDKKFCGKQPLRHLLASKLGSEFAFRGKRGFTIPLKQWFSSRQGVNHVREQLLDGNARILQWFEPAAIQQSIDGNSFVNTWLLLVLEEWMGQVREAGPQF